MTTSGLPLSNISVDLTGPYAAIMNDLFNNVNVLHFRLSQPLLLASSFTLKFNLEVAFRGALVGKHIER